MHCNLNKHSQYHIDQVSGTDQCSIPVLQSDPIAGYMEYMWRKSNKSNTGLSKTQGAWNHSI